MKEEVQQHVEDDEEINDIELISLDTSDKFEQTNVVQDDVVSNEHGDEVDDSDIDDEEQ